MNAKTSHLIRKFARATKESVREVKRIYNRIPRPHRAGFKTMMRDEILASFKRRRVRAA